MSDSNRIKFGWRRKERGGNTERSARKESVKQGLAFSSFHNFLFLDQENIMYPDKWLDEVTILRFYAHPQSTLLTTSLQDKIQACGRFDNFYFKFSKFSVPGNNFP